MYTNLVRRGLGILAVFLLTCSTAAAQSISGVVKDTSDAVLPGVAVDATNAATQQVRSATTDTAGRYVITGLQPGNYAVSFTLPGFSSANRSGITLTSDFTATVDMQLKVGVQSETI